METKSLFLQNITGLDCGVVTSEGHLDGRSYNVSVVVTGEISTVEAVVVDFSTLKKSLKGYIDSEIYGFDHKLLILEGASRVRHDIIVEADGSEYLAIKGKSFELTCPTNAVKFVKPVKIRNLRDPRPAYQIGGYIRDAMSEELLKHLQKQFPNSRITEVEVRLNSIPMSVGLDSSDSENETLLKFNYIHGLKNSSSWGCQNIAHGHTSFIQVPSKKYISLFNRMLVEDQKCNVFVMRENIINDTRSHLAIRYECPRGVFGMCLQKDQYQIWITEKETTIENLAEFLMIQSRSVPGSYYFSEGLQKGSLIRIPEDSE